MTKWQQPGYDTNHHRARRVLGRAAAHICTDCDNQADQWTQIHDTTGDDPKHYEPRCFSCHALYDGRVGSGQKQAKLTEEDVLAIRRLHASGGHSYSQLASVFGVNKATVGKIVRREKWQHV